MFRNQNFFAEEDADTVRNFMKQTFENYMNEGSKLPDENWSDPIKKILSEIENEKGRV